MPFEKWAIITHNLIILDFGEHSLGGICFKLREMSLRWKCQIPWNKWHPFMLAQLTSKQSPYCFCNPHYEWCNRSCVAAICSTLGYCRVLVEIISDAIITNCWVWCFMLFFPAFINLKPGWENRPMETKDVCFCPCIIDSENAACEAHTKSSSKHTSAAFSYLACASHDGALTCICVHWQRVFKVFLSPYILLPEWLQVTRIQSCFLSLQLTCRGVRFLDYFTIFFADMPYKSSISSLYCFYLNLM